MCSVLSCWVLIFPIIKQWKAIMRGINLSREEILKHWSTQTKRVCIPVRHVPVDKINGYMLFPALIPALVLVGFDHYQTPAALIVGLGLGAREEIVSIKKGCRIHLEGRQSKYITASPSSWVKTGHLLQKNIGFVLNILSRSNWICQFGSAASIGQQNRARLGIQKGTRTKKSGNRKCVRVSPVICTHQSQ